jgi:hypothetical protein
MERTTNPVLVVFEFDFMTNHALSAWEALSLLGILPIPKLSQNFRDESFDDIKMLEVWPSSQCEIAFRNNILPEMEQAGVRVRYQMYTIRQLGPREIDFECHASRLMLCN